MRPEASANRLQFLDALRGIAALAVVLQHGFAACIPGYLDLSIRYFDLGQAGVTLFFLISGFIIPMTLERGRSNARFWINRFFRLFPLYWATIAFFGFYYLLIRPDALYPPEPWQWVANLTMLQEWLRVPHVSGVFWTLTLELAFYALCSLLYAGGLLRWTGVLVWIGQTVLFLAGVVLPLLFHRRFPGGYAFLYLTMIVGMLFQRRTTGQLSRRHLTLLLTSLTVVAVPVSYVSFALFERSGHPLTFHCVLAVWLSGYVGFMAAFGRRDRCMPGWLRYLGRISYSVYLTHAWLILVLPTDWSAFLYMPTLVGGTLALATLTYFTIERPGIALGLRLLHTRLPAVPSLEPAAASDAANAGRSGQAA